MVQGREELRFARESRQPLSIGSDVRWENLDRDVALQARIARAR